MKLHHLFRKPKLTPEAQCKLLGHQYQFTWFEAVYQMLGYEYAHCTRCGENHSTCSVNTPPGLPHYIPGEKTLSHGDTTNVRN